MSIYDIIAQAESGGNATAYNPAPTSSGNASGLYQITSGTWTDFAPGVGVNLAQYPTAASAPASVQTAVASQIPLSRWAPSTVAAVQAQDPSVNTSSTLGQIATNTGGTNTGTTGTAGSSGLLGSALGAMTGGSSSGSSSGSSQGIAGWIERGFLLLIGVVVIGLALWGILKGSR